MDIQAVAALVTVVSMPIAVVGVYLVWQQLRQMRTDRGEALGRHAAAVLPALESLRLRVEADWGCDIVDRERKSPNAEEIDRLLSGLDSDIAFAGTLRSACAEIGLREVILAEMFETDLKLIRFALRAIERATVKDEQWVLKWPKMVHTQLTLLELIKELESVLPTQARLIGNQTPGAYRAAMAERTRAAAERMLPRLKSNPTALDWPPPRS